MSISSVFITGANRGLGLEFVKQWSTKAAHVFATCRIPEAAEELQSIAKSKQNVHIIKLDTTNYPAFQDVVSEVKDIVGENGLNILINNAGIYVRGDLNTVTPEDMLKNYEVNVASPLELSKSFLPLLKVSSEKGDRASIINITSKMGSIDDNTSGSHYAYRGSKTAMNMVTKCLSVDLKPMGISCIAIHPGWVQTDMGGKHGLLTATESVSNIVDQIIKQTDEMNGKMINFDGKIIPW